MKLSAPTLPRPGVTLFRVDYGYPDPAPTWAAGWETLDLSRLLLPRSGNTPDPIFSHPSESSSGGLVLRNADRLLAWGRLRGKGDGIGEVAMVAAFRPVVLLCRFPRHAEALRRAIEGTGVPVMLQETPRDGSTPPLYRGCDPGDPRVRLHLELEWVSALAHARGNAALEQVGLLLASGPLRGCAVALSMGITQGAARSYLQWMEDVALVRREGRLFDFAHPLLALRLKGVTGPGNRPRPQLPSSGDDMSVD